jgi:HAD superfamily hydrolase (TIGR01509 family)
LYIGEANLFIIGGQMQNNISVIVFDLGNVLIPFDYSKVTDNLNKIEAGLGQTFYNLYRDNYDIHRKFERWELSNEKFLDIMMDWTGNKVSREEFCRIYSDLFVVNEDTTALLPELKKHYTLVVLSNTNHIHQHYGWKHYEFLKHFDKLILSHEVGAIKPEEKIFKAVESFTGKPAEEHLFIDDIAEYVEGAKSVGWDSVQFVTHEKLLVDFRERGIKLN